MQTAEERWENVNDEQQPVARSAREDLDRPARRSGSRATSWVTVYDGPRRTVTITAARPPGHHCDLLVRTDPADGGYSLWRNDDGDIVVVELSLDDRGIPVAPPPGLSGDLLGSMTLWPRADVRYVWWHEDIELFPDNGFTLQDAIEPLRP